MALSQNISAQYLNNSASAYAAYAATQLLEKQPKLKEQFGESAFSRWRDYLCQKIHELAAAVDAGEPALFQARVGWEKSAFQARDVADELLKDSLICLHQTLSEELPENSRQIPCEIVKRSIDRFDQLQETSLPLDTANPAEKLVAEYLVKILDGNNLAAINMVLQAVEQGMTVEVAYEQVLLRAQQEIGRMWHAAEVSIAEEHFVTATTRRAITLLWYRAPRKPSNGKTVVSASVSGNIHDIGVRGLADFFDFAGWRSVCLGADTPGSEIAESVRCFDAQLVLISATLGTHLNVTQEAIQLVRRTSDQCKILVGGMLFRDAPDLWQRLGADGFASTIAETIELGKRLTAN